MIDVFFVTFFNYSYWRVPRVIPYFVINKLYSAADSSASSVKASSCPLLDVYYAH